mgnify:CR=1 FL=1
MVGRAQWGGVVVFGGGLGLCLSSPLALAAGRWSTEMLLYAAPAPLLLAVALLYAGRWIVSDDVEDRYVVRVAAWFLLGILLLGTAGWLTLTYQATRGVLLVDGAYLVANWATGGGFLGLVTGVYDSQRKRRERRLAEERATTHELNQRLSVLNRILRHDLRNGLNVVQGHAVLLQDGERDPAEAADVIADASGDLLAMSDKARRLEGVLNADGPDRDEFDLAAVVERLADAVETQHPDADVRTAVPDRATVPGGRLVEFALECVLENAVEHSDRTEPAVDVSVTVGERVRIRVADDGPGIPEDEREVIERDHETPLAHSSGFGLWLAKWIVEDAGGDVTIEDNHPRGAVVVMELPGE